MYIHIHIYTHVCIYTYTYMYMYIYISGSGGRSMRRETGRGEVEMDEVEEGEEGGATKFWAQCDRCKKWRHLEISMQDEVM